MDVNVASILATDAFELELIIRQAQLSKECGVIGRLVFSLLFCGCTLD